GGPESGGDVQPRAGGVVGRGVGRVPVQSLGAGAVEVAVGDDRAGARQAQLPAVGVAGDQQVVPVAGVLVEDPEVRRVRHPDTQVGLCRGGTGDGGEVVVPEVGVVDPGEGDLGLADAQTVVAVGEVAPAARGEALDQLGPGELWGCRVALAVVGEQVLH